MKCPFCGADETTVADTRLNDDGDIVRRRRRCLKCEKRFTTYERAELRMPQVIKKNGSRVEFDRDKLAASLWLALRKRPVSIAAVEATIARIEEKLLALGFSFKYLTHTFKNKDGKIYFWCYDYGYLPLDHDWYLIVKTKEE